MARGANPGIKIPAIDEASPAVRSALQQIVTKLGLRSTPKFAGAAFTGLTASRLVASDSDSTLESSDLASWVAGTANEINVADDGDGTITIGIVDPLVVGKGGTGVATLTTPYGLLAAGTIATGAIQTLAAGLATQILVGGGAAALPEWGTDIPTAVTIGSKYVYRAEGTDIPVVDGGTGVSILTDHGILLGSGTDAITPLGVATNGQLPIGSTGADPILATLTGTENQIEVTNGAGSITLSLSGNMDDLASLTPVDGNFIVGNETTWVAESGATARTSMGLGDGDSPSFAGLTLSGTLTQDVTTVEDSYGCHSLTHTIDTASGNLEYCVGAKYKVKAIGSNNITNNITGSCGYAEQSGTGTIALARAVNGVVQCLAAGTITAGVCLSAASPYLSAGAITSQHGVYIFQQKIAGVTTGYGIYQASSNDYNVLVGNTKFGAGGIAQEDVHAADTVRADTAFNLNGTDGVTDTDTGVISDVDISGGIVISVTKQDWMDQAVKTTSTPSFAGATIASAMLAVRPTSSTSVVEAVRLGRTGKDYRYHSIYESCSSVANSYIEFRIHDGGGDPYTGQNTVLTLYGAIPEARISGLLRATGNVRADTAFNLNGTDGITTTFLDADGNTITVSGGIITAKTAP